MKIKVGKKTYWNPLILVRNIFILACILFLVWTAISYGEIVIKNLASQDYSDWNLFILLKERM